MFLKSSKVAVLLLCLSRTTNAVAGPPSGIQTRPPAANGAERAPEYARPRSQAVPLWQATVAGAMGAGAYFGRRRTRYDDDETKARFTGHTGVGPGGWLALSVGGKLSPRWRIGVTLAITELAFTSRFSGKNEHTELPSVGPELTFQPLRSGVFAYVRPELAWFEGAAIMASVGGGYAWRVGPTTSLGLGVQLSGFYSRFVEEADNSGVYRYTDDFIAPSLVVRVASP